MFLQVYKGLSIATAKATNDEQMQAPHHLLDIATPHEPFTVTHFRDKALPIVSNFYINLFYFSCGIFDISYLKNYFMLPFACLSILFNISFQPLFKYE
jgi:uncharacterized membrane protein YfhO